MSGIIISYKIEVAEMALVRFQSAKTWIELSRSRSLCPFGAYCESIRDNIVVDIQAEV